MMYIHNAALIKHAIRQNIRMRRALGAAAPASSVDEDGKLQMTETRIYVGLNDAETKQQLFETEQYLAMLAEICRGYHAAFTVQIEKGGYFHEDGRYTEETSLALLLIDTDRETVRKIAEDLRVAFRQESVLVTEDRISGCFITEESGA